MMHGSAKILHVPHQPHFDDIALFSLIGIGGMIELTGGLLVLTGLFTRPVAFILSGEMAVAYFMFHAPSAFLPLLNEGDSAVLYCFVFLYLAFAGPGPWSVDAMWRARRYAMRLGGGAP